MGVSITLFSFWFLTNLHRKKRGIEPVQRSNFSDRYAQSLEEFAITTLSRLPNRPLRSTLEMAI